MMTVKGLISKYINSLHNSTSKKQTTQLKYGQENRRFSNVANKKANRHMKRCLMLIMRNINLKITMRYHLLHCQNGYHPKRTQISQSWYKCGRKGALIHTHGNVWIQALWKAEVSQKKHKLDSCEIYNFTPGYIWKNSKICSTQCTGALFTIAVVWK